LVSRYINLTNVDLPAPLGPTTYTNSPGSMLILIPFNAVIPVWYVLYTSFMIIIYIFTFIIYSFVTSFSSRIFLDLVSFDYVYFINLTISKQLANKLLTLKINEFSQI